MLNLIKTNTMAHFLHIKKTLKNEENYIHYGIMKGKFQAHCLTTYLINKNKIKV